MEGQPSENTRRLPVGAEIVPGAGGVHFRVRAPRRRSVDVVLESDPRALISLAAEGNGYFSGAAPQARGGTLYRFRLDGAGKLYPDPASRFQPDGVHGPSQVIDPAAFHWTDASWPGTGPVGVVLYELHIGTFTKEGTWDAAIRELPSLADLGVSCLEIMPVSEFAGRFGWGYDGVDFFAPSRLYGSPDDFRRFVDRAHAIGIGVILDVVYNHFGPDGNYLPEFSADYTATKHKTDWGGAVNFDGPNNKPVREFFLANARYWVEEFHVDGYRYDATQAIVDDSPVHILAELSKTVRNSARGRKTYLVNENEPQHTRIVRPLESGGHGMDALWNDDFHHSAMVALTGRNEAYYTDHLGSPQEFISAAKWGYLFQGQRYHWQKNRRGTPGLELPPTAFVNFIQNHDQIANSGLGLRASALTSRALLRTMTAVLLLSPQTPMLFQGQEFAASSPFFFFADHQGELRKLVCAGRAREVSQFPSLATPEVQAALADPCAEETFHCSKIDHAERGTGHHAQIYALHRDLLRLRREEAVLRRVQRRGDIDGAVLGPAGFVLRYFGEDGDDRLLLVNFGIDLSLEIAPEPLLAPPTDRRWSVLWSSEDVRYGGGGTPAPDTEREGWFLPGRSALVLRPGPIEQARVETRFKISNET
jgi:maltooligosyltrehalose trehalohydrolase